MASDNFLICTRSAGERGAFSVSLDAPDRESLAVRGQDPTLGVARAATLEGAGRGHARPRRFVSCGFAEKPSAAQFIPLGRRPSSD